MTQQWPTRLRDRIPGVILGPTNRERYHVFVVSYSSAVRLESREWALRLAGADHHYALRFQWRTSAAA